MKHTKGPWQYFNDQIIYDAGYGGPFRSVCQMNGNNNEANAHLISAAPDMLEALSEAWGYVLHYTMTQDKDAAAVLQKMDKALKKAKGEV